RGTFGDPANDMITGGTDPWNDLTHQMVDQGGGHYTATVEGTYIGEPFDYKLANSDYSTAAPGSNGRVVTNNNGEVNFHLWTNNGDPWTDGWYPNSGPRAGYDDPQQFGWEVIGSFNNWRQLGTDPVYSLADMGNGLYTGTFALSAGSYNFKFREQDSWDVAIGNDFGNSAANIPLRVWDDGAQYTFSLDLPNGRWQAVTTSPTPDLNGDGYVDASDYVLWRKSGGSMDQYNAWKKHFGEAPPPPPPTAFFARGTFNNYDESIPMTDEGGNVWDATVTGLTPGTAYNYKLANDDYSQDAPQGAFRDGTVPANDNGEIHFHLFNQTTWSDGWNPSDTRRAGFDDPHQFNWELMGDLGDGSGYVSHGIMTDEGGGLYSIDATIAADGTWPFKFRKEGDWGINIGVDFANNGADASTGMVTAGTYEFDLDLRNGRWRVIPAAVAGSRLDGAAVPEPASIALIMMTLALIGFVPRNGRCRQQCG
ncbi:MAG TPA: PEP-CTERM sorting domain-containing protein, partial [Lacipirellulaceae bacterium]|nr:PEP-CTERM sorting domain-containing protein [Lacipirellulaceae bacterium]